MIIELNDLTPDLTPGELLFIKSIILEDEKFYNKLCEVYSKHYNDVLKNLEIKQFIKITGEEFSDIILRSAGLAYAKEDKFDNEVIEILSYLNQKLDKKRGFSLTSKSNCRFVRARLKDGYSKEDLKSVIDVMVSKWKGSNLEMYLRPETIFGETKFQSYLQMTEDYIEDDWTRTSV